MIEVKFYNNGFEINGHAIIEICHQVSILSWFCASSIGLLESTDWYTSSHDNSNVGYSHFVSSLKEDKSKWLFDNFNKHLKYWADYYKWEVDSHVKIIETNEVLIVPDNFKEVKNIVLQ